MLKIIKIINNNIMDTGIFDPEGNNLNPLNNQEYSEEYRVLSQMWSKLPAYKDASKILQMIKDNEVILIQSETGTGKSVICPKIALHSLNYNGLVIMTLPKKDITKSSAIFSAKTMDTTIGEYIGYQFRGEQVKSEKTKILYSTDGSIISMIKKDPLIMNVDIMVIDEVHERKVQIDLLLYLIKNAIKERKDKKLKPLKLIIMSATVDKNLFEKYYKDFKYGYLYLSGITNYEITDFYIENSILQTPNSYVEEGIKTVKKIVDTINEGSIKNGDIIFFVCSVMDCLTITTKLNEMIKDSYIMALYSGFPKELEIYLTNSNEYKTLNENYNRRIFISTNIAESSLTINNIVYVVDNGLEINIFYNQKKQVYELNKSLITKAQIQQRRGRTGRTQSGFCYHLYTKKEYEELKNFPDPEIKIINLTDICLAFFGIEYINNNKTTTKNIIEIFNKLIEPPEELYIKQGFDTLENYELIKKNLLTKKGLLINETGLDINCGLTLLYAFNISDDCFDKVLLIISICANLKKGIDDLFFKDISQTQKNKIIEKCKTDTESYFTLLYNLYIYMNDEEKENCNIIKMDEIKKFYKKYSHKLFEIYKKHNLKIDVKIHKDEEKNINECFKYGFSENKAVKKNNIFYFNDVECDLRKSIYKYENKKEIIFFTTLYHNKKLKLIYTM